MLVHKRHYPYFDSSTTDILEGNFIPAETEFSDYYTIPYKRTHTYCDLKGNKAMEIKLSRGNIGVYASDGTHKPDWIKLFKAGLPTKIAKDMKFTQPFTIVDSEDSHAGDFEHLANSQSVVYLDESQQAELGLKKARLIAISDMSQWPDETIIYQSFDIHMNGLRREVNTLKQCD